MRGIGADDLAAAVAGGAVDQPGADRVHPADAGQIEQRSRGPSAGRAGWAERRAAPGSDRPWKRSTRRPSSLLSVKRATELMRGSCFNSQRRATLDKGQDRCLSRGSMKARLAIYDMDRTITRRATYTPFLIHAATQAGAVAAGAAAGRAAGDARLRR